MAMPNARRLRGSGQQPTRRSRIARSHPDTGREIARFLAAALTAPAQTPDGAHLLSLASEMGLAAHENRTAIRDPRRFACMKRSPPYTIASPMRMADTARDVRDPDRFAARPTGGARRY
jgi:hypothetical protein